MNSILAITYILPLVNSSLNPIFNVAVIVVLMRGVVCLANTVLQKEADAKRRTGKERVFFLVGGTEF